MGKLIVIEFSDDEELDFQQALEYLSKKRKNSLIPKRIKKLSLNTFTRSVDRNGKVIHLTAKEFDLLYFLYLHKGQVFSKEQIYENVWGHNYISDSSNLTSFIRKLRRKIEDDPDNPKYILTVWGVGYKFNEEKT